MSAFSRRAACALGLVAALAAPAAAYAQTDQQADQQADRDEYVLTVFVGFIAAVVALGLYVARDAIFAKKTDYDRREYASKEDKTSDKYASGWHDDYVSDDPGPRVEDHYATLGVSRTATGEEIKSRYRELAKKHHPDRGGGDPGELARINEAYEILSDEKARREYDGLLP